MDNEADDDLPDRRVARSSTPVRALGEFGRHLEILLGAGLDPEAFASIRNALDNGFTLDGAKLAGENLIEANLRGANLRGADLREANLFEPSSAGPICAALTWRRRIWSGPIFEGPI